MSNNRIYYAIQQVAIKRDGGSTYQAVHGLQSVSTTTNFSLSQVFELGQLSIYENIEEIPEVQVSLNKVLDGYIPIYCLATQNAVNPTLAERANHKCCVNLTVYNESSTSATGAPIGQMESSGLYVSSVRYSFPKDGNFAEEVSLVGNHKIWKNDSRIVNTDDLAYATAMNVSGLFGGNDSPIGLGGVARRQDLIFTGAAVPDCTKLPVDVAGISSTGVNDLSDATRAHINNISVSANINRDNLTELGRKAPYFRNPTFPIEVSTEIEIIATSGDMISATEGGILSASDTAGCGTDSGNLPNGTIYIATCEGLRIYCGNRNKLASVNYGGGDAGGGQVNVSYTYQTFNDFTVVHSGEQGLVGVSGSGFWVDRATLLA